MTNRWQQATAQLHTNKVNHINPKQIQWHHSNTTQQYNNDAREKIRQHHNAKTHNVTTQQQYSWIQINPAVNDVECPARVQ